MRKIILLFICIGLLYCPTNASAKIVADQEFNDSVVFYFWENWDDVVGFGTGSYWIAFIKHVDKTGVEKYWLRLDSNRRDSIGQYGKIVVAGKEYKITALDNPSGMYQRAGVGNRVIPHNVPVHAFYDITTEIAGNIATGPGDVKMFVNFQKRKDIPLMLDAQARDEFKKLMSLKQSDYKSYAR